MVGRTERPIGSKTGVLIQVVAASIVTIALLAMIEIAAHFFVSGPPPPDWKFGGPQDDAVATTLAWLDINPAPLVRDVDLLWRNQPGARKTQPINPKPFGRDESWTVENNSEGFRGPERSRLDGEPVYRVVCVGDSVTFGFNVDQPDTYPRRLEQLLATRHPNHRFEVINTGVPGWSWLQGLRFVQTRGLSLRPDAVVIGHGTNDQLFRARITDEERFRLLEGPFARAFQSTGAFLSRTNTYRLVERLFPPPAADAQQDSPRCRQQIRSTGTCHRVSLEEIAASVHEVGRIMKRAGIDLLVVNLDFVGTAAVQGVRAGTTRELPFLDAVAVINGLRSEDEDQRSARFHLAPASRQVPDEPRPSAETNDVLLRVVVPDRAELYRAEGKIPFRAGFEFAERLYDDGTHGDEVAGDGVFSVSVRVPGDARYLSYVFYRGDVAEFTPLPPIVSMNGDRLIPVHAHTIAPVDVFAQSLFMAERAHPNRDGTERLAELIANELEAFPSFTAFIGAEPPRNGPTPPR